MKKLLLAAFSLVLVVGVVMAVPQLAHAAAKDEICQGVGAVSTGGCSGDGTSLDTIIKLVVNIFSSIIGITAVVMLMVAGYKYVGSGGDSGKVASAKSTILYAVIGLVIVAMAQTIVWFVLQRATETDAERKAREDAAKAKATYLTPAPTKIALASSYYTIEFNNNTVL